MKYLGGKKDNSYLTIESKKDVETVVQIHLRVRLQSSEGYASDMMNKEES